MMIVEHEHYLLTSSATMIMEMLKDIATVSIFGNGEGGQMRVDDVNRTYINTCWSVLLEFNRQRQSCHSHAKGCRDDIAESAMDGAIMMV